MSITFLRNPSTIRNMMSFLNNHPFAVEALFEYSLVLTFAVPKEQLQPLIPECVTLDTLHDKWAFVAVAMVQTKDLRPKGFPKFLGSDFFLIGYRIFVRYTNSAGKRLRGLYILKSETDSKRMEIMGSVFTKYRYSTIDTIQDIHPNGGELSSKRSGFYVKFDGSSGEISLPPQSPFADWKEARKFAGPLPFTFSYNPLSGKVLIVEGVRQNWTPEPAIVSEYSFPFLESLHLENPLLANAFIIRDIPYAWKKGVVEQWRK